MNGVSFRTLEFDQIRALLLQHAGSESGRRRILALAPLTEVASVREALSLTSEGVRVLQSLGRQPYHDLPDVTAILPAARVQGLHLEPLALSDVASFIEGAVEIARRVARHESAPRLAHRASLVRDTTEVAVAIRRAILPGGEVADDASPKLAETRRALARLRAKLTSVMDSFLQGKDADRVLQDKLITTRNDRYVVLLKAEHRGQIPGIVHGSSGSGASVFVEPLPAVDLNNDIVELQDEERREIVVILRALTVRVGDRADDLSVAAETMGELDAVQAMAMLARDMRAVAPQIASDLRLDLIEARHPLLMPHLAERLGIDRTSRREPVPVSIRVGFGDPVLVISGPNTGGKTVALKTAGLLALMAQCGLHIPAAEGSLLPVFRRLYADIGDEQSIAANLSTFSAHLATIVEMTKDLEAPALVLLDEVGAGTDPTEGGALGVAIVDHFRGRGAMVVATTHHGLMKAYAQSTPGVACASFGYDPLTYEPTYRLALGVPGRSLALEMAERLGLPAAVVADARSRRDEKQAQAEDLLARLEKDQAELELAKGRLAGEQLELNAAQARVEILEREAKAKKKSEAEAFARELRRRTEEAARKAADAIRDAVQRVEATRRSAAAEGTRARTDAVQAIREAHDEAVRAPELELAAEVEATEMPIAVGSRVRLRSLAVTGEVTALHEQGGVEVAVSGKRLRVPRTELVALEGGSRREAAPRPTLVRARSDEGEAAQVNLVGLRVDEALPRVDKALDDAALADRQQVRVVHGFGEGKLRRAVAEMLEGHPHVASWRSGAQSEGGGGVTIVERQGLMAFPDSFVDEVRRAADIVRVISEHMTLRKMGTSWKGLCPFHQEKTPSFNVRSEPAIFHCFGCGAGGDVFKFLMLFERVSFPEAVEALARRHSIAVPESRYEVGPDRKEREELLAVMEAAAQHFERTLWTAPGQKAREYLLGRGFKKETLEKIRAGASRDSWDDLLGTLRGKFSPSLLLTAGLVLERQGKDGQYDRFRNRAMFSILNESGKVVAFGARCLDGSEPKYLNSPETPAYQKSRTLYGLSWAKEKIRQEGAIVLMEGYLDVARAHEAGITEAVATCGTALTTSHARLVHRFAERVILNFDQDEAGQKAARKSFDVLIEEGLRVQVVELPAGEDPDTYLKSAGAEAYRERLASAPDAIEWLMRRGAAEHDLSSPVGKGEYIEAIIPTLAKVESAVERAAWLRRVAERAGIDEVSARDEMKRFMGSASNAPRAVREAPLAGPPPPTTLLSAEKCFLSLLLQGAEGISEALGELTDADVAGLGSAPVLRAAKGLYLRAATVDAAALQAALAGDPAERFLTAIAVEGVQAEGVTPVDCVRELKRQPLKARMAEIQRKLKEAPGEAVDALLQEKNRLASQMASL